MELDRSLIMHTTALTADDAIKHWAHHYHQIERHPEIDTPDTASVDERGRGLGVPYHNLITYRIVVVRYRYSARGHWRVGYVGYAPTITKKI
jgi:hypothetical protein